MTIKSFYHHQLDEKADTQTLQDSQVLETDTDEENADTHAGRRFSCKR